MASCPPAMTHAMVDVGANLTSPQFKDAGATLARAWAAGVHRIVVTGTSLAESTAAVSFCRRWASPSLPRLYCTVGCHPHDAWRLADGSDAIDDFRRLIEANRDVVVAVGECGLDYERNLSTHDQQRQALRAQIQLSIDLGLPLFVHARGATFDDFIESLSSLSPSWKGVVHCYTDTDVDHLKQYLELGFHIGITGWICDERPGRGGGLGEIVARIPLDRLLIETDSPYLMPRNIPKGALKPKPKFNEPALLGYVAKKVATCYKSLNDDDIARMTAANAVLLFRLQ